MAKLLADPQVLNDGTADRTYDHISDTEDSRSYITTRSNLNSLSVGYDEIITKQSKNTERVSALVSKTGVHALPEGVATEAKPTGKTVWNLTYNGDPGVSDADAEAELTILMAAAATTDFVKKIRYRTT